MGREAEPARLPSLDSVPIQVPQPAPCVPHVPSVVSADEIRHQKRRSREAELREHRIGVRGKLGVAVVEGQQELGLWSAEYGINCEEALASLIESERILC